MVPEPSFGRLLIGSIEAIGQMGIVAGIGYAAFKREIITSETLSDLTKLLFDIVVPCMLLVSAARGFNFSLARQGIAISIMVLLWILGTYAAGAVAGRVFPSPRPTEDRAVLAMTMIQNSLYLPLPLALAIAPAAVHDQIIVYIALATMPATFLQWTLGLRLLASHAALAKGEWFRLLLQPPLLAFLAGSLLSQIPAVSIAAQGDPASSLPLRMVFAALSFISTLLSPLAIMMLGAYIASSGAFIRLKARHIVPLISFRLVLIPALVLLFLLAGWVKLPRWAAFVLMLQAAAPPAIAHAFIARRFDGEWELVAALQCIVYLAALITLPLWLAAALKLFS